MIRVKRRFAMKPFSAGSTHSIFVTTLGEVYTSGTNTVGAFVKQGGGPNHRAPRKVENLPPIKAAAAGDNFSLFLDFEGNVWGAGKSNNGQLGRVYSGGIRTPEKLALPIAIQAVAASHNDFSLFLDINGNVWGCGVSEQGQLGVRAVIQLPTMIPSLPIITDVSAGTSHALFLDNEMNVWGVGNDVFGQLGLGITATYAYSPKKMQNVPASVSKISAGSCHSLLLDANGQAWACGRNENGQLALAHRTAVSRPQPCQGLPPIAIICAGNQKSIFVDVEGKVWRCGNDKEPELLEGLEGVQCAESFTHNSIFLDSTGTVWVAYHNKVVLHKVENLPDLAWDQGRFKKTKSARKP